MINPASASDFAVLTRFAVVVAGQNEETEQLVHEVLEDHWAKIDPEAPFTARILPLLRAVWQNRPQPPEGTPISNVPPAFQWITPLQRATATLQNLGSFTEEQIAGITGEFAPQDSVPIEKIDAAIEAISVSPELLRRLSATAARAHQPFRLLSPLGLSLIFSGLVFLAVGFWIWHDWSSRVDENVAGLFIQSTTALTAESLEAVDLAVEDLPDHLYLKHGLENYPVPASFAQFPATKVGVNRIDDHLVVQVGFKNNRALVTLFHPADFGLDPNDHEWRLASNQGWAVALRSEKNIGTAVTLRGSETELKALLPK